jgi:hypothetical protein
VIPWRKLLLIGTDLARVNGRYLVDAGQRNRMREVLKRDGMTWSQRRVAADEARAAAPQARPYAGLASTSLTLAGIRVDGASLPHLNLLISEVREGGVFAGIHTALTVSIALSRRLGLPLRIVMLDFTSTGNNRDRVQKFVERTFHEASVDVVPREQISAVSFSPRDIWMATHSKTAHAAQVACASGAIDRERVAYFIQDYEPGFSPWSTESVLATSTYRAGFVPIINSTPLSQYLAAEDGLQFEASQVVAPSFETEKLRAAAAARKPGAPRRVLFYARPSKHRNLYHLGVSALRAAFLELGDDASSVEFFSAGEDHEPVDLGGGRSITRLGPLPWNDYFEFLASTSVMLSLQQSPHPSHPPFDAAISGAVSVTNDFHGTRAGLHPRIIAVPADTQSLAKAIVAAIRNSDAEPPNGYLPVQDGILGRPLDEVLTATIERLRLD